LAIFEGISMRNIMRAMPIMAAVVPLVLLGTIINGPAASASTGSDVIASYNGGTIDLSTGWGTAKVCVVGNDGTSCFGSQSEYQSSLSPNTFFTPLTACSSGLQLYEDVSYGGNELILSQTGTWINLSSYSFSDVLSSYKVGACDISMTDSTGGSGNVYPGATSAGSDVSWIGTTWNDRVQSVYIF
jgi:hypothetical protein